MKTMIHAKRVVCVLTAALCLAWGGVAAQGTQTPEVLALKLIDSVDGLSEGAGAEALDSFRFSAAPELPDNQADPNVGYFYLLVAPGDRQTLAVNVRNASTVPITVNVAFHRAFTNSNGLIQYTGQADALPAEEDQNIETMVSLSETALSIDPGATKRFEAAVTVPETPFEGSLLGGFLFTRVPDASEQEAAGASGVRSLYSHLVALQLTQTREQPAPEPAYGQVALNTPSVWGEQLLLEVENPRPVILKPFSLDIEVTGGADPGTPLLTSSRQNLAMAPASSMTYVVRQEGPLDPGEYQVVAELTYKGEVYRMEETVTVPPAD